jgi:glutathionylspermidine synthase
MNRAIEVRPVGDGDPLENPALARELAQKYFIWDAFVAGQRRVDVHPLVLSSDLHRSAVAAAEGVVRAVGRVAGLSHTDEAERAVYNLHPDVLRLSRASHLANDNASLMRVDLLLDESGEWKACEINADCPGGHNEAVGLPRLARESGFMAGMNPTTAIEGLCNRLEQIAQGPDGEKGAVALLYATAYAEDLQVCALVRQMLERRGVRAILAPPTAPRARRGTVVIGGTQVRALYHYVPTEWMEGQRNVAGIADAIEAGQVKTLTGFSHIYTQSKFAFTRAWHHKPALDAADRDVVERHLPQSFDLRDVPRDEIVSNRAAWVVKRSMGRVGDQVFVGSTYARDDWTPIVDQIREQRANGEVWLAQRFVRQRPVPTPWGDRYVTLGAYVLEGRFAGYFARITPQSHVSHDALCVPVFALTPESAPLRGEAA